MFSKEAIMYKGKLSKLEIFDDDHHKAAKSLPVHKKALEAGLRVPKIYNITKKAGRTYKYSEWVDGKTIQYEMDNNPALIEPICMDLGRYVNALYDVDGITPVDCHFLNFVWHDNQVIYIDLKKLFYEDYEGHIVNMSKICLKSCQGDRNKALAFLKGYVKYRDAGPIIEDCDKRGWRWKPVRDGAIHIEPIKIEEVIAC